MTIKWELDLVNVAAMLIALGALCLAWRRLSAMLLQVRANTLLALDQRWESEPMSSYRSDVRNLIEDIREKAGQKWPGHSESERRSMSRELYAAKLQEIRVQDKDRYIRLFQICGFFETVAYVARANHIPVNDVMNLLGGSIGEAGMVFAPHIEKLHAEEGGDKKQYEHFIWLVGEKDKWLAKQK